jgi:hypothetical protein
VIEKPTHSIRADHVEAHVTPTPFVEALDRLLAVITRYRERIDRGVFPPQIVWRPDDAQGPLAAE